MQVWCFLGFFVCSLCLENVGLVQLRTAFYKFNLIFKFSLLCLHWFCAATILLLICAVLLLCRRTRGQFFGLKLKLPLFVSKGDDKPSSGLVQSPRSETFWWRCQTASDTSDDVSETEQLGVIARPYVCAGLVFFMKLKFFCLFFVSGECWSGAVENCHLLIL